MSNEVSIRITANDDTQAVRAKLKAAFATMGTEAGSEFSKSASKSMGEGLKPKIKPETDEQSSEDAGKKTTEAVSRGMSARGQLIATAIGGAIVAGGPLIDAAGIGTGVLFLAAMGAAIQKGNPALEAGWAKLKDDATTAATAASMGMVGPLDRAMGEIDGLIQREAPLLKSMFDDAAQDVPILTQAVVDFTTNALPGLESGLAGSQQIMSATAGMAAVLGKEVGEIGSSFGQNSQQAVTGINALSGILGELGHTVATVVDFTTRLASGALPTLASGLGGVLGVANGVLHILEPIAPALGSIAIYGVEAWGSFKLAGLATSGVESLGKSLGSLSSTLVSAGAKLEDSSLHGTKLGSSLEGAALKGATFAEKLGSVANNVAGPLGLVLGVASAGMMLFGQSSADAAQKAQQQAQTTADLAQALQQSHGVIDANVQATVAQKLATDDNVKTLTGYGVSITDVSQKLLQGNGAIDKQIASLQAQKDAVTGNAANYVTTYGQMGQSSSQLTATARAQVGAIDGQVTAWQALEATMPDAIKQQKAYDDVITANSAAMGINVGHLNSAQNAQEAYDSTLNAAVAQYMQNTSAIKQYNDAVVAAAGANLSAKQQFQQLDDAVSSAQQAVTSASVGVANAQHSIVDAGNAVDAARHSEQQAVQAVTDAQYSYQQSLMQEKQAQQNVMAARQAAADQLQSLQRQMADQGDSLASAKLRLEQAQAAVAAAGLSGTTLASLGDPTASNAANFQLLLNLSQAQHALNDTQAQGVDLAKQNAAAQKAGIEGNAGVISAEQQLADAKHSTAQAALGVQNATYAERQASLAVSDAIWAQHSAQTALTQAQQAGLDAQKKLSEAKDADSRTLDINTEAGNRNWQTVEDLYYKNLATTGSVQAATKVTEDETTAMGFNKDSVQGVIDTLGGINNHTFNFSVVGTPNLDLGPMQGILKDPNLGLFTNGKGDSGGIASAGRLATGGPVTGPGGPRDDLVPLWASAGEYMQPADVVDHYGLGFMEALRQKKVPKYANGGPIAANDLGGIMALNAGVSALAGIYEGVGITGNALHAKPSLPTALSKPGNFSAGAFGNMGGVGLGMGSLGPVPGVPSSRAANEAIVNAIWAGYGWNSGAEWDATIKLLMQESGFNNTAQNPTSTAYGMFQFLDTTWAGYGIPKTSDPTQQTIAGGRYLKSRYGDPLGAEAHEKAFNWYGAGGPVTGGIAGINDHGPELVRLPSGSTVVPNSNTQSVIGGGDRPVVIESTVIFSGDTDSDIAALFQRLLRQRKLRIEQKYISK